MATYLVGDVQGCFDELAALLHKVHFHPQTDELWLAGDLVARGPKSLETLRLLVELGDCVKTVLGNHDLHLLAIYHGIRSAKANDKLTALLDSADCDALINWLTRQPLLRALPDNKSYLSHAGISPQWTIEDAIKQARFCEKKLHSDKLTYWLTTMYGNEPNQWHLAISPEEKFRYSINAFTRMRYCFPDGSLEFNEKMAQANRNTTLSPWFTQSKVLNKTVWYFGHWAAIMGKTQHNNAIALDTGCVWGNHMTMIRWHDKKIFIEPAHR